MKPFAIDELVVEIGAVLRLGTDQRTARRQRALQQSIAEPT